MSTFADNKKLTMIQLLGGPGIGKSSIAPKLFAIMKENGHNAEFIHEVAKGLVYDNAPHMFYEQDWIFAHQHRLQRRLVDYGVQYAVTDTSIILGLFYMDPSFPQSLGKLIEDTYNSYTNVNVILDRNPNIPYQQSGRNQNEQGAIEIDVKIRQYFDEHHIPYFSVQAGSDAAQNIYDKIFGEQ